jgi:hypothetical protein
LLPGKQAGPAPLERPDPRPPEVSPMTRVFYPILSVLLAVACGSPLESTPPADEPAPIACGPNGYVIRDTEPGDRFIACADAKIQAFTASGGELRGAWDGGCVALTVLSIEPGAELVVQLRGPDGAPLCADAFERL